MKRLITWGTTITLAAASGVVVLVGTASAATCTPTSFTYRGQTMTAAQIGGTVTGTLNASGCDIGVYDPSSVSHGDITGATYFGVVVDAGRPGGEAAKGLRANDVVRALADRGIYLHAATKAGIVEEAPGAYKNVEDVVRVAEGAGLTKIVARMVPLGVVKG